MLALTESKAILDNPEILESHIRGMEGFRAFEQELCRVGFDFDRPAYKIGALLNESMLLTPTSASG